MPELDSQLLENPLSNEEEKRKKQAVEAALLRTLRKEDDNNNSSNPAMPSALQEQKKPDQEQQSSIPSTPQLLMIILEHLNPKKVKKMPPEERLKEATRLHNTPGFYEGLGKALKNSEERRSTLASKRETALENSQQERVAIRKTYKNEKFPEIAEKRNDIINKYTEEKTKIFKEAYKHECDKRGVEPGSIKSNKEFDKLNKEISASVYNGLKNDPEYPGYAQNKELNKQFKLDRAAVAQEHCEAKAQAAKDSIKAIKPAIRELQNENNELKKENSDLKTENKQLENQAKMLNNTEAKIISLEPKPGSKLTAEEAEKQQLLAYQKSQNEILKNLQSSKDIGPKTEKDTQSLLEQEKKCEDIQKQLDGGEKKFTQQSMVNDLKSQQSNTQDELTENTTHINDNQAAIKQNNAEIRDLKASAKDNAKIAKEASNDAEAFERYQENFDKKSGFGDYVKDSAKAAMKGLLRSTGMIGSYIADKSDESDAQQAQDDQRISKFIDNEFSSARGEAAKGMRNEAKDTLQSDDLKQKNKDSLKEKDGDKKDSEEDKQTNTQSTSNSPSSNASDDNTPSSSTPTASTPTASPSPSGP